MAQQKHILVTALYWGLGHAVRCIPIIDHLLDQSCRVSIASDGQALSFLQKTFPDLSFFELPSYNVSYPTRSIYFNLALSTPSILSAISKEYKSIQKLVEEHHFDAIIADNRYGCRHEKIPSVLITHQVNLIGSNLRVNKAASKLHQSFIQKFNACWIPDISSSPGLSASMGHGSFDFPAEYLGFLSNMQSESMPEVKKQALIIVLSGPEPQRSKLEDKLLDQLHDFDKEVLIVRGLVKEEDEITHPNPSVRIVNYLNRKMLLKELHASEILLSRPGYTTLMDLAKLKMQAILIPTPGQPEQEYLSKSLLDQGIFYHSHQDHLNLNLAFQKAKASKCLAFSEQETEAYKNVLDQFLIKLEAH